MDAGGDLEHRLQELRLDDPLVELALDLVEARDEAEARLVDELELLLDADRERLALTEIDLQGAPLVLCAEPLQTLLDAGVAPTGAHHAAPVVPSFFATARASASSTAAGIGLVEPKVIWVTVRPAASRRLS
jgi:hypothetical protein